MPGVDKEVDVEEFFERVADYINPIADKSDNIGFCFSYPAEIMPDKEGKIMSLTKEVKVENAQGALIGKELKEKLDGGSAKKVVVLNDATATLLSGKAMAKDKNYDDFIGLILGTGMNTCYGEKNENIKKSKELKDAQGYTLINLESGGYGNVKRGTADINLDKKTANPGKQLMEKMLSGAYMGQLVLETLKMAASEGILSESLSDEICALEKLHSADSAGFLDDSKSSKNILGKMVKKHGSKEDGWLIEAIVDGLYERSAKYLAININGILVRTGKGKNPEKPVCLVVDGSAFYGSIKFREKFDGYLEYMKEKDGRFVERMKVEDASLMGSAIAGLLS
jgi:hexokinase